MMNKFLNINGRISYIIENQCKGNRKKFAEIIGFAPQVISNIVSGRKSKPSFDVLNSIILSFDDVNPEWLLTGKGEMLKPSKSSNTDESTTKDYLIELQRKHIDKLEEEIKTLKKAKESTTDYLRASEPS